MGMGVYTCVLSEKEKEHWKMRLRESFTGFCNMCVMRGSEVSISNVSVLNDAVGRELVSLDVGCTIRDQCS